MVTLQVPSSESAAHSAFDRITAVAKAIEPLPADRPTAFALFFVAYENMRLEGFSASQIIDIQMMLERDRATAGNSN